MTDDPEPLDRDADFPFYPEQQAYMDALSQALDPDASDTPVLARVRAFGSELFATGRGLPSWEAKASEPYCALIAARAHVAQSTLSQPRSKALLRELGDVLGYEVTRFSRDNETVIVAEIPLVDPTPAAWPQAVRLSRRQRSRRLAALGAACGKHYGGPAAEAGSALQALLADGDCRDVDLRAAATAVMAHIQAFETDGLPNDTRERLRLLLDRRGMSIAELARQTDSDDSVLREKIGGRRRLSRRDNGWLELAEGVLAVPVGSLRRAGQYGQRGIGNPRGAFPKDAPTLTPQQRLQIALFLPEGFAAMADDEKLEHIAQALSMRDASVTPERAARVRLQADAYAVKAPLPDWLDKEARSIAFHYGENIAPTGVIAYRKPWSQDTLAMRANYLFLIMGFLAHASRGTAALDTQRLSTALLVQPQCLEPFFAFRNRRRDMAFQHFGVTRRVAFTEEYLGILEFLATLFHPVDGWATQSRTLRHRLSIVARHDNERERVDPDRGKASDAEYLLNAAFVTRACPHPGTDDPELEDANEAAWRNACKGAYDGYRLMIRNHRRRAQTSRDSHQAVEAILRLPRPMDAMKIAIAGIRGELAKLLPFTAAYASTLRDLVALGVEMQTGFRRRTILALDWREDNRGHLFKQDARWWLRVPRELFKVPDGPYFRDGVDSNGRPIFRDYEEELEDVDGFYEALESYLRTNRAMLTGGRVSDAMLVGSYNSKEPRLTRGALEQMSRRIWRRHVLWNATTETGVKGIYTTAGWHAWRHIIATDTLKQTASFVYAADSIQDSVDVARVSYARYTSRDRDAHRRTMRRAALLAPMTRG